MTWEILLAAVAIAFLAATCQSVTGFGFALVMAPLITVVWAVKPGIAATVLLSIAGNLLLLANVRGDVSRPRVLGLLGGWAFGLPAGLLMFDRLSGDSLQIIVASVVLVATILLYFQPAIDPGEDPLALRMFAGALSGAAGAATSMGGPPAVLYLIGRETDVNAFRATLMAYFLPSSIVTAASFAAVGQIDSDVLAVAAVGVPGVVLGGFAGAWLRRHLDPARFRRVVVGVLIATSLSVIAFTIGGAA